MSVDEHADSPSGYADSAAAPHSQYEEARNLALELLYALLAAMPRELSSESLEADGPLFARLVIRNADSGARYALTVEELNRGSS